MKLLWITFDRYPESGACTSLMENLFREFYLLKSDLEIHVIAPKYSFSDLKDEVRNGVFIHRVYLPAFIHNKEIKRNVYKHPITAVYMAACKARQRNNKSNQLLQQAKYQPILNRLQEMLCIGFDYIIPICGDYNIAYAVLLAIKQFHSGKVILYQVDPCASNGVLSENYKELDNLEYQMFNTFDAVCTTPILYREYQKKYNGKYDDKLVPVEFPNVVPVRTGINTENTERVKCVFAGFLYKNIRDPSYCIRLFEKLADHGIDLFLVGVTEEDILSYSDHGIIHCLGRKSLEETRKILYSADALVNIGNSVSNQVPSKLFEYISYGKPILNICKSRNCPTLMYCERNPVVLSLYENDQIDDELIQKVEHFLKMKKTLAAEDITFLYKECTPEFVSGQFMKLFQEN